MRRIFFLILLMFLFIPFCLADSNYGEGVYGGGLYGIGEEEAEEIPSGGGGGGIPSIQFDIKILKFESPINLGEFFDFMYLVKGVGDINDDITIDFWIEKNGEIITSGSDVIFMGSNEEKIESASLFMPSNIDSGTYKFVIRVSYGNIKAESHRTIELTIIDGKAIIDSLFDIRFLLEDIILTNSDELSAIVIFENFGLGATPVDLTFIILDEKENEIYREEDNITVETEEVLRKSFKGLNLDLGKYTIVLNTLYGVDVRDEFRQDFEIRKERMGITGRIIDWTLGEGKWWLSGILLLLVIGLIWYILKRRKKKKEKLFKKPMKERIKAKRKIKKGRKSYKSIHQRVKKEVGNL